MYNKTKWGTFLYMLFKKLTTFAFLILFGVFLVNPTYANSNLNLKEHTLPYPGILPDNPLFLIKSLRDKVMLFSVRDFEKKVELYLALSNKHLSNAVTLINKNKSDLGYEEIEKSQEKFLNIPYLIKDIYDQGGSLPQEMLEEIKSLNLFHKEVIVYYYSRLEQKNINLEKAMLINLQIQRDLKK